MVAEEPKVIADKKYSIQEAAKILRYTPRHVYRFIKSGDIKCGHRLYTRVMFITGREIERFKKVN